MRKSLEIWSVNKYITITIIPNAKRWRGHSPKWEALVGVPNPSVKPDMINITASHPKLTNHDDQLKTLVIIEIWLAPPRPECMTLASPLTPIQKCMWMAIYV
jgi:hypothetical protein